MNNIEQLRKEIQAYQPINELEEMDKKTILSVLDEPNILSREQLLHHITSSCWVVNHNHTKVLMIYHNIYQTWSWMGGHNDGNANSYEVAKKELEEESGIKRYITSNPNIFSLEIIPVFQHIKRGTWVPSHLHLNITYLFVVDEKEPLIINEEETAGVKWIDVESLDEVVREKEMLTFYHKLMNKCKNNTL
jgi:ADP-ribose pyrophosphatase YjhB (NUDIX family)